MFASDSRKVAKYTRMLSAPPTSRESEADAVFSSSTEKKRRRGYLLNSAKAQQPANYTFSKFSIPQSTVTHRNVGLK